MNHPAHQGRAELRHWRSERMWYHSTICSTVAHFSRYIMRNLNTLELIGRERWDVLFESEHSDNSGRAIWPKRRGRGLLSVSNHVSLFDDPLLISNLSTARYSDARWIAADQRNFFGSNLKGAVFSAGKCVPIIRGEGLDQPGLDFLRSCLERGEWVHIFPEGGRSRVEAGQLQRPLKVGVGKLIYETNPMVMPFYHYGMHQVQPIGARFPRRGQTVRVLFGEATQIDDAWWEARGGLPRDDRQAWSVATEWVESQLLELESVLHPHAGSDT